MAEREDTKVLQTKILRTLLGRLAQDPEAAFGFARELAEIEPDNEEVRDYIARIRAVLRTDEITSAIPGATAAATVAGTGKPSIAVLPFANFSGGSKQEAFADGISEDIITDLAKSGALTVIARNSSFEYKNRAVNVGVIGRELGVDYVLEGSVRKEGRQVRVSAQLVEADSGAHLWADRYDRQVIGLFKGIFAIQDEVTLAIVTAVVAKPGGVCPETVNPGQPHS